jgi:hypothetical protein
MAKFAHLPPQANRKVYVDYGCGSPPRRRHGFGSGGAGAGARDWRRRIQSASLCHALRSPPPFGPFLLPRAVSVTARVLPLSFAPSAVILVAVVVVITVKPPACPAVITRAARTNEPSIFVA